MVKYKNVKKESVDIMMKKVRYFIVTALMLWVMFGLVSVQGSEVIRYEFNEGGGTIVLDISGNGFHGIAESLSWSSSSDRFSTAPYSAQFSNSRISTAIVGDMPEQIALSTWYYKQNNAGNNTIVQLPGKNESDRYKLFYTDNVAEEGFGFTYETDNLTFDTYYFNNSAIPDSTFNHIMATLDHNTSNATLYINNTRVDSVILQGNVLHPGDPGSNMYIGATIDNIDSLRGTLDSFRLISVIPNSSQRTSLYTSNTIDFAEETDPQENVTDFEPDSIITSYSPVNGSNESNPVTFEITLTRQVSCDLYINNEHIYNFENKVANTIDIIDFETGVYYDYFWYCEYIENETKYYEISNTTTIFVNEGNLQEVTFQIIGNDFNVADESLYITTPCMNEGVWARGLVQPFNPDINPGGIHFKKLDSSGIARLNLSAQTHEFCLYNGRINYADDTKRVTGYDIVDYWGQLEIGDIDIPNNVSNVYVISVDKFEIYDKFQPKAWGTTWVTLVPAIIMVVMGLLLLIVGGMAGSKGATAIGGLLMLSGFGIELGSLFLGILV